MHAIIVVYIYTLDRYNLLFSLLCYGLISEQIHQVLNHMNDLSHIEVLFIYTTHTVMGLCSPKYITSFLCFSCTFAKMCCSEVSFLFWCHNWVITRTDKSLCVCVCWSAIYFNKQHSFSLNLHKHTLVNLNQSPFRTFHFKWFHLTVITKSCEE